MPTNESDLTPSAEERWTLTDKGWNAIAKLEGVVVIEFDVHRTADDQKWFASAREPGRLGTVSTRRQSKAEAAGVVVASLLRNMSEAIESGARSVPCMVLVRDAGGAIPEPAREVHEGRVVGVDVVRERLDAESRMSAEHYQRIGTELSGGPGFGRAPELYRELGCERARADKFAARVRELEDGLADLVGERHVAFIAGWK